jgi:hypothetical protein
VYSQRTRLALPKPDDCSIARLGDEKAPQGYEIIGTVSLVRRNYQTELSLDADALRKVDVAACRIGGDVVSFGASNPNGADFLGFRKVAAPAAPTNTL